MAIAGIAAVAGFYSLGADMTENPRATLTGGGGSFLCLAFAPDGKLVAGGNKDGSVMLWDPATGAVRATLRGHEGYVFALAFSPDGRTLASGGGDRTARLWDVAAARQIAALGGHEDWVTTLAFTPDGKSLATATGSPSGVVRLWDLADHRGRVVVRQADSRELDEPTRNIYQIAITPDGRTLAVGVRSGVFLWDLGNSSIRASLPAAAASRMAVAPDGKTLATGAGNLVALRDPGTGRERSVVPDPSKGGSVAGLAFTPDGRKLLIGQAQGPHFPSVARSWDLAAGRESARIVTDQDSLRALALSPDGNTLATASDEGGVKLWDLSPKP